MPSVFRFLLFFLIGFAPFNVLAQSCDTPSPRLSFETKTQPTEYIRSESSDNLTQWQRSHNSILGTKVLGVGGGQMGTKLAARYEMVPVGRGLYCLYPQEIKATFYIQPEIHIASNFARGSCEYSEVLVHEQKHIDVLRKFQREYKSDYEAAFRNIARTIPASDPIPIAEGNTKKKEITGFVMEGLNAYTDTMMEDLNARQRAIDTKEEYARVMSKCKGWDKKLSR